MGRPASNGAPSFRFNSAEVTEMESILQAHKYNVPERDLCQALADKFSRSAEREGKVVVQMKQIWNWFQNRRYAIRAKNSRAPGKLNVAPLQRNDLSTVRSVSQAPQHLPVPPASSLNNMLQVPQPIPAHSGQNATKNGADNSQLEFEAKSSRDGAWYDVSSFLSHRSLENGGPAVLVRFAGFGPEEDEWINVQKNVRLRSLPCESSECVAVLPNDLILCFQEGKEQALYYDAHVLDAQRRRHDARGCRCRFLVRYDHDQSEEIVALRKVCRRPETDYRLQQLHADSANSDKNKSGSMHYPGKSVQVHPVAVADSTEKKAAVIPAETTPKQPVTVVHPKSEIPVMTPVSFGNMPSKMSAVPLVHSIAGAMDSGFSKVTTTVPVADNNASKQPTTMITSGVIANTDTVISLFALTNTSVSTPVAPPMDHSNAPPPSAGAVDSNVSKVINTVPVEDSMPMQPPTMTGVDGITCEMPMNHSHSHSPSAVSVDSSVPVSVADTTPDQPANTPPLTAPDSLASADVNISTAAPDSHSNASLISASAGGTVDSSVSTMVTDTDPAALSSMPNQPSSTGVDANTGAVISPVSPANTCEVPLNNHSNTPSVTGAVDSSVVSVNNTDPVLDSSSSLTYTVSPATTLNDAPLVTEITISLEELERSATIDDEGNLNTVDADPVVTSGADNISNVSEVPGLASGANNISDVTEDPGLAIGADNISDVSADPGLASGANNISDVSEDPGVASSGGNYVSDVSEDPGVASGGNNISDVGEDAGENMQID